MEPLAQHRLRTELEKGSDLTATDERPRAVAACEAKMRAINAQNLQQVVRWLDTIMEVSAQASYVYQTRISVLEEGRSRVQSPLSDFDRFESIANRCSSAIFRLQDTIDRLDKEHIADPDLLHTKQKLVEFGRDHVTALVKLNKMKQELMKGTLAKLVREE